MVGQFLLDNLTIIAVIYGLSFFVIFFAVVLQRGQSANFELVNTFLLLAGFGLLHGIGDILFVVAHNFGGVQEHKQTVIQIARYFLAGSFTFLYLFGLSVFLDKSKQKIKWSVFAAPVITLVFFVITTNPFDHIIETQVIYRLFLGFPSAMLASMALLKMSQRFRQLNLRGIVMDFRGAALFFFLYGIFAGLFFVSYPNSILVLGLPVQLLRAAAVIGIAFFTVRIMAVFKL
ncbi:MAG: hypothetical protein IBX64_04765 [Actinobacteria bacterium]|nr:hypothetical protein [Actinomycetota bacterium]